MRSPLLICGLLLSLAGCKEKAPAPVPTPVKAQSVTSLRIGVLPNEKTRDLDLFKRSLEERVKLPVEIVVPESYSDLVERFKTGQVDFAFFTALTFLQAEREAAAKVLLKKVYGTDEFYYAAILVRADSKFKNVKDLKGKRFAFVDKKSTSGYLFPRVILRSAGVDDGTAKSLNAEFYGTHEAAIRAVKEGKADAAGVWASEPGQKKGAWTASEFKDEKTRFRALAYSDPIPNDAFVTRQKYYEEHPMAVYNVMEALIGMGDDERGILKKVFDVDRMATATSKHYDSVRTAQGILKEEQNQ